MYRLNKNAAAPFKSLIDGKEFNYKPTIHNLTDGSFFVVFGNKFCVVNALSKQMKFYESTLGNAFHQINKNIYLFINKYICDIVANKILKELV